MQPGFLGRCNPPVVGHGLQDRHVAMCALNAAATFCEAGEAESHCRRARIVLLPYPSVHTLHAHAPFATLLATPHATPRATPLATTLATPRATPLATPRATSLATPLATTLATTLRCASLRSFGSLSPRGARPRCRTRGAATAAPRSPPGPRLLVTTPPGRRPVGPRMLRMRVLRPLRSLARRAARGATWVRWRSRRCARSAASTARPRRRG